MPCFNSDDEVRTQLETECRESAKTLFPLVQTLQLIVNYSQLVQLDPDLLEKLVRFETARVNLTEHLNPAIDFQSSGHHRDKLEILQDALKGQAMVSGIYIYMREDGRLEFNLADVVESVL